MNVEQLEHGVFENDNFTIIMCVSQTLKGAPKTLELLNLVVVALPNFSGETWTENSDAFSEKKPFSNFSGVIIIIIIIIIIINLYL